MEQFTCRYCDASFGIAGALESDEDWEAQSYFDEQARHHLARLCRHRSTPDSVLAAPIQLPPIHVHVTAGYSRQERRHGALVKREVSEPNAPYTSTKVRKVRHGRKARWNR